MSNFFIDHFHQHQNQNLNPQNRRLRYLTYHEIFRRFPSNWYCEQPKIPLDQVQFA